MNGGYFWLALVCQLARTQGYLKMMVMQRDDFRFQESGIR
jgi:hypothetical protein